MSECMCVRVRRAVVSGVDMQVISLVVTCRAAVHAMISKVRLLRHTRQTFLQLLLSDCGWLSSHHHCASVKSVVWLTVQIWGVCVLFVEGIKVLDQRREKI